MISSFDLLCPRLIYTHNSIDITTTISKLDRFTLLIETVDVRLVNTVYTCYCNNFLSELTGTVPERFKDRHGGFGRDSWYLHVNVYP